MTNGLEPRAYDIRIKDEGNAPHFAVASGVLSAIMLLRKIIVYSL